MTSPFDYNYKTRTTPTGVTPYNRPYLKIIKDAVDLVSKTDWNGRSGTSFGLSYTDFDQQAIAKYVEEFKEFKKLGEIPEDKKYLFDNTTADVEINKEIQKARSEFLEYLKKNGVAQKYITEIDTYVLPTGRLKYVAGTGRSKAGPYGGDYSQVSIELQASDTYKSMNQLVSSNVFGTADPKKYRDGALRLIVYHEMTHVLQQAYINLHVTPEEKAKGDQNMWENATKTLLAADTEYYWSWVYNNRLSEESQANGLMLHAFGDTYGLNSSQKQIIWNAWVGKDALNANTLFEIGKIFHQKYPTYLQMSFLDFGYKVYKEAFANYPNVEDRELIKSMLNYTIEIPKYVGYFNPMEDYKLPTFWGLLED
ncbi:MAG: hypothetical protein ACD_22C00089G0009 [uncultured bacterium]|nr:MAG: hypothetical protein ACD_22C00089G0009 [uncultured bacterium]